MAVDERQTAAANYVITFSNDIQNLNHSYAQYYNTALQLAEFNKNNEEDEGLNEQDKGTLTQAGHILRYYVIKTYIAYRGIVDNLESWPEDLKRADKEINSKYKQIKPQFLWQDLNQVEQYIQKINNVLVNTVISSLLETSQAYLDALYNESNTN